MDTPTNSPNSSARPWANPKMRYALLGLIALIGALVAWRVLAPRDTNVRIKGKAETELETIMDTTQKTANQANPGGVTGKSSDQPAGDPEAIGALHEVEAKKAIEQKKQADAEDAIFAQLAFQHFSRRLQGLSYDEKLAQEWERRVAENQRAGKGNLAPPSEVTKDDLEQIRKTRPDLYEKWTTMRGEKASLPALAKAGGASGAAQAAMGGLPAGIDPRTGLPAAAAIAGQGGDELVYALLEDGTPDISRGAIPVTIQYTPPGSQNPVTMTKWIRPGYLTNRVRSADPRVLAEEDEAFRRSLKESTDIPMDSAAMVAIPYRYTNAKTRVSGPSDFNFQNHYVVVLPNPKGKLSPPNPPVPGGKK